MAWNPEIHIQEFSPGHVTNPWPCNPDRTLIALFPKERKIKCFGGGYGGSSFLGRKCLNLSLASALAREEGWMAEHMLVGI